MPSDERKELQKWVVSGRSSYENGNYICIDDGHPLDFVSVLRFEEEQQLNWHQSLSEEEVVSGSINIAEEWMIL